MSHSHISAHFVYLPPCARKLVARLSEILLSCRTDTEISSMALRRFPSGLNMRAPQTSPGEAKTLPCCHCAIFVDGTQTATFSPATVETVRGLLGMRVTRSAHKKTPSFGTECFSDRYSGSDAAPSPQNFPRAPLGAARPIWLTLSFSSSAGACDIYGLWACKCGLGELCTNIDRICCVNSDESFKLIWATLT